MGRYPIQALWMPIGEETGMEELGKNWGLELRPPVRQLSAWAVRARAGCCHP